MGCFCHGGHGPNCPYYEPFCTNCGKRVDADPMGHDCTADRYCGSCGGQVAGWSINSHSHHICPGRPAVVAP